MRLLGGTLDPKGEETRELFGPCQADIHRQATRRRPVDLVGADRPEITGPEKAAEFLVIPPGRQPAQQSEAGIAPVVGNLDLCELAAVLKQPRIEWKPPRLSIFDQETSTSSFWTKPR